MHPHNPYRNRRPDFKALASKYEEFRVCCDVGPDGKIALNFRVANNVRVLTQTLLRDDFGLNVELPVGTLVPRVPQRLNYIYWISDQLKLNRISGNILGIDIGTGSSCIYPLLGSKQLDWHFIATDSDVESVEVARRNVENNGLSDLIEVIHVDKSRLIKDIVHSHGSNEFVFCMCNPPFFEQEEFEQKFKSLDDGISATNLCIDQVEGIGRSLPQSATIAKVNELTVSGGEVAFISRLIDDSCVLRRSVTIYTTLVGKKASLVKLRTKLETCSKARFTCGTLNQGKTRRWILAWSFEPTINFMNVEKAYSPITLHFPSNSFATEPMPIPWIKETLKNLEISYYQLENGNLICDAHKNTWSSQRRKRRAPESNRCICNHPKHQNLSRNDVSCAAHMVSDDRRVNMCNADTHNECSRSLNLNDSNHDDTPIQILRDCVDMNTALAPCSDKLDYCKTIEYLNLEKFEREQKSLD